MIYLLISLFGLACLLYEQERLKTELEEQTRKQRELLRKEE